MNREEGAGTALAVALVAAIVVVFGLGAAVAVLLETRHRVVATADAAALAAADTALGNATGVPCDRAAAIAVDARVSVESCRQRGALVRVGTAASVLGVTVRAVAVAGPPP